jgi:exosortase/archaeosortase family protein
MLCMTNAPDQTSSRRLNVALIVGIGVLLTLMYWPLLAWLMRVSLHVAQLSAGALLVVFAAVVCLQDSLRELRFEPQSRHGGTLGVALLALGFACLWLARRFAVGVLPLVVFSFCASFAAIIAFLFGRAGIRQFLPALGGFFVFGLLVGLFPTLDWPLRAMAAKHAGSLLAWLGVPVRLLLERGKPAELALDVGGRLYSVATECNGFGLLTSAVLLATILAFQYRLPWPNKLGLLALSIPIAIVCNFLRIVSICLVAPRVAWSYSFVHEALGTIFYFAGLALVWLAARHARG